MTEPLTTEVTHRLVLKKKRERESDHRESPLSSNKQTNGVFRVWQQRNKRKKKEREKEIQTGRLREKEKTKK